MKKKKKNHSQDSKVQIEGKGNLHKGPFVLTESNFCMKILFVYIIFI